MTSNKMHSVSSNKSLSNNEQDIRRQTVITSNYYFFFILLINNISNRWYFGTLGRQEAVKILICSGNPGDFLVRETPKKGDKKLSVYSQCTKEEVDAFRHYTVIQIEGGKFHLESCEKSFSSVDALIGYYLQGTDKPVLKRIAIRH